MDKSTLSQYGWVTIVIIIIVILLGFAAPVGNFISDSFVATVDAMASPLRSRTLGGDFVIGNITMKPLPEDSNPIVDGSTNYSIEDIENNNLILPIGKTKPEYVVAVFNEDLTVVTIAKNGANSDGLMADFGTGATLTSPADKALLNLQVININEGVVSVGNSAFKFCLYVSQISLPSTLETVGDEAFGACTFVTDLTLPDNLKTIGSGSFYGMRFTEIVIPQGVSVLKDLAFGNSIELTTVSIPSSVTEISDTAFSNASKLSTIKGVSGSYAESWATENGYTFVAI